MDYDWDNELDNKVNLLIYTIFSFQFFVKWLVTFWRAANIC